MKEIEKVSLGGYAFTLESDAAKLASDYLGELERHYTGHEGGSEILESIEERMAELLQEKCGYDGVASLPVLEDIIGILGRPEDIEQTGEEDAAAGAAETDSGKEAPRRKLYRDMTDKVVAGVCSGLAARFRVDVVVFRIIFAAGTLASLAGHWHGAGIAHLLFPLAYLILWLSMPPARTVRQRWEQRGEDGTIRGIQESIENAAHEVGEAIQSVGRSGAWSEIGRVFEKLIGAAMLIVGFTGLFAGGVGILGSGFLGAERHFAGNYGFLGLRRLYAEGMSALYEEAPLLANALARPWVQILLLLVVFLPFLAILYGALQLLFGFKSPKWKPGLVIFILWLMSVIAAAILLLTGVLSTELLTV